MIGGRRHLAIGLCTAMAVATPTGATLGQTVAVPSFDIWGAKLGEPVGELPIRKMAFAACGTNGGPPSTVLDDLDDYAKCRPEASGLRELYFEYDDEQAYIARALRLEWETLRAGTTMSGHPIIASILVDADGIVRGIRVVTDDRTTDETRVAAVRLATHLKGRFSRWPVFECEQIPPSEGEAPVGTLYVHDICRGSDDSLGQRMIMDAHYFRRQGQRGIDIHSQQVTEGLFESKTRFELVQVPYEPTTVHDHQEIASQAK